MTAGATMVRAEYTLRLSVPAFLGGADQRSEWRAPPIKAMLRHWWRVAVAKEHGYDWKKVRVAEAMLFGHAWLDEGKGGKKARRSRVEIALSEWKPGDLVRWPRDPKVRHQEVERVRDGLVGAHLYLGYGPLEIQNGTGLRKAPALANGAEVKLRLRFPANQGVERALALAHYFGSLGGRSRNGWGSCELLPASGEPPPRENVLAEITRPWRDCLREDWPHAIGTDDRGPLVWTTASQSSWSDVMKSLAEVKIAFRTMLNPGAHGQPGERHLLAYPVTNHPVTAWEHAHQGNRAQVGRCRAVTNHRVRAREHARLANQIRFKVVPDGRGWRGVVIHVPTRLPERLRRALGPWPDETEPAPCVFAKVHRKLGEMLTRCS